MTSIGTSTSTARGQRLRPAPRPSLDLGPTTAPGRRLLKRAGNLFTAQGEPAAPAVHEILASGSQSSSGGKERPSLGGRGVGSGSEGNGNSSSSSNLGASLRRTLSEVKNSGWALRRGISVGRKANGVGKERGAMTTTRHGRSFSENLGSGPLRGLTPQQQHRRSATFASKTLSPGISEGEWSTFSWCSYSSKFLNECLLSFEPDQHHRWTRAQTSRFRSCCSRARQ